MPPCLLALYRDLGTDTGAVCVTPTGERKGSKASSRQRKRNKTSKDQQIGVNGGPGTPGSMGSSASLGSSDTTSNGNGSNGSNGQRSSDTTNGNGSSNGSNSNGHCNSNGSRSSCFRAWLLCSCTQAHRMWGKTHLDFKEKLDARCAYSHVYGHVRVICQWGFGWRGGQQQRDVIQRRVGPRLLRYGR